METKIVLGLGSKNEKKATPVEGFDEDYTIHQVQTDEELIDLAIAENMIDNDFKSLNTNYQKVNQMQRLTVKTCRKRCSSFDTYFNNTMTIHKSANEEMNRQKEIHI